jgi:glycosyltransferase involved in cell wall biosynthesis
MSARDLTAVSIPSRPKVSVVVPVYNHERFVEEAIDSIYRQTYPEIELIVIDDGSRDRSAQIAQEKLRSSPFPTRFLVRENRGAHATINEGLNLAAGEFVNVLNSDDLFSPRRIELMVALLETLEAHWGFSRVRFVDEETQVCRPGFHPYADNLARSQETLYGYPTVGAGLLFFNFSVSTGNIFARRKFLEKMNGFRDLRFNHDWDFCLRALLESEPAYLAEGAYLYRIHGKNTILESKEEAREEAFPTLEAYLRRAGSGDRINNDMAPSLDQWGDELAWRLLAKGMGHLIGADRLMELADKLGVKADQVRRPMGTRLEAVGGLSLGR